jgi:hypothetical protein
MRELAAQAPATDLEDLVFRGQGAVCCFPSDPVYVMALASDLDHAIALDLSPLPKKAPAPIEVAFGDEALLDSFVDYGWVHGFLRFTWWGSGGLH